MFVVKILCNKTKAQNHSNKCLKHIFKWPRCVFAEALSHMRNQMNTAALLPLRTNTMYAFTYVAAIRPNTIQMPNRHTLIRNPDRDIVRRYSARRHFNFEWNGLRAECTTKITAKLRTVYAADLSSFKCTCKQLAHRFKNDCKKRHTPNNFPSKFNVRTASIAMN